MWHPMANSVVQKAITGIRHWVSPDLSKPIPHGDFSTPDHLTSAYYNSGGRFVVVLPIEIAPSLVHDRTMYSPVMPIQVLQSLEMYPEVYLGPMVYDTKRDCMLPTVEFVNITEPALNLLEFFVEFTTHCNHTTGQVYVSSPLTVYPIHADAHAVVSTGNRVMDRMLDLPTQQQSGE